MVTFIVEPPSRSAPPEEWAQYIARLQQLQTAEPGNHRLTMMLALAKSMGHQSQKFNPYHHGSGDERGGEFTDRDDSTLYFEAAPDPNDKELTRRWETLSAVEKETVSNAVVKDVIPEVLKELGAGGKLDQIIGGYAGYVNPAYSLEMDDEHIMDAAKLLGYSLGQDSMAVVSGHPMEGLDKVGVVTVNLPAAELNMAAVKEHYGNLGKLVDDKGQMLVSGFTVANGSMHILNFSDKTDEELAALVDKQLGSKYTVYTDTAYSTLVEKKDYLSAGNQEASGGTAAVWRESADRIREAATRAIHGELRRRGKSACRIRIKTKKT
jgi:hypothetical protein